MNLPETFVWVNSFVSYAIDSHCGRQSRRDYIFGHSIITIPELLTWILAPNREQCCQNLPQSILWIFHKKEWDKKKPNNYLVFKTKTCWSVKVLHSRDLFSLPLLLLLMHWVIHPLLSHSTEGWDSSWKALCVSSVISANCGWKNWSVAAMTDSGFPVWFFDKPYHRCDW